MDEIKLFEGHEIRAQWNREEMQWYFSITDFLEVLCGFDDTRKEWRTLKRDYPELELFCYGLRLPCFDGKKRIEECANKYGINRILAVLPISAGIEVFKHWLKTV